VALASAGALYLGGIRRARYAAEDSRRNCAGSCSMAASRSRLSTKDPGLLHALNLLRNECLCRSRTPWPCDDDPSL
jgi:hypothetical protein